MNSKPLEKEEIQTDWTQKVSDGKALSWASVLQSGAIFRGIVPLWGQYFKPDPKEEEFLTFQHS